MNNIIVVEEEEKVQMCVYVFGKGEVQGRILRWDLTRFVVMVKSFKWFSKYSSFKFKKISSNVSYLNSFEVLPRDFLLSK